MSTASAPKERLLIAGLTPPLLEKPVFWFERHEREILRARAFDTFWRRNSTLAEIGMRVKLSELLRDLHDLGYATVQIPEHPGELTYRGDTITIFPINSAHPWHVSFLGNIIETILPARAQSPAEKENSAAKMLLKKSGLQWLCAGDFVVHADHGIGLYRGTEIRNNAPYLILEYAAPKGKYSKPDILRVPEELAQKVSPYIGFRTPTLHRLGTPLWNNLKKRTREDVVKLARELLELYAKRSIVERAAYVSYPELEDQLAATFAFEETPDQTRAVTDVFKDMRTPKPMDRLLLADVGFGKTEIAVRSALRSALNGRQVVIVCPTTVLCDQHTRTFRERLRDFPVSIERLSRLESGARQRAILKKLAQGSVDILIATHRALSKDILFKNLGLVILDEEQRFGVKQKEHLKNIRAGVDILSLSATPIPRTLNLALSKLRDMSVIATPPPGRIPPKTFVLPFNPAVVKNALAQELSRGGQTYFLCNHIRKIPLVRERIQKLAPQARIGTLHGHMGEEEIIEVMEKFRSGAFDTLISTTIIENGLDISNANTLIVQDATRIGLAQAHQLRGRIGRGSVQSYAYFLYPAQHLKEKAGRRLDALFRTQYLGAGHDLALRDLEIRGAGNILGRDQSGRVNQIGLNLYCQMLAEAIEELRE